MDDVTEGRRREGGESEVEAQGSDMEAMASGQAPPKGRVSPPVVTTAQYRRPAHTRLVTNTEGGVQRCRATQRHAAFVEDEMRVLHVRRRQAHGPSTSG